MFPLGRPSCGARFPAVKALVAREDQGADLGNLYEGQTLRR